MAFAIYSRLLHLPELILLEIKSLCSALRSPLDRAAEHTHRAIQLGTQRNFADSILSRRVHFRIVHSNYSDQYLVFRRCPRGGLSHSSKDPLDVDVEKYVAFVAKVSHDCFLHTFHILHIFRVSHSWNSEVCSGALGQVQS